MTATGATLRGRAAAEGLMVETCTISRPSTTHTTDPTTGAVSYGTTPVYAGKCRVQMFTGVRGDNLLQAAERAIAAQSATISIPIEVTGIRVGDVVKITVASLDGDLLNRSYRVEDIIHKTFLTARRLICQEFTG